MGNRIETRLEKRKAYRDAHKEEARAYRHAHRKELSDRTRAWRAANKEKVRARDSDPIRREKQRACALRRRYGLTLDRFQKMWSEQRGCCACCEKPLVTTRPVVDHDHRSSRVRGLLCAKCNTMVAMANDAPSILEAGARYLQRCQTALGETIVDVQRSVV